MADPDNRDEPLEAPLPEAWDALRADPAIGVSVVDLEGRILFSNRRAAQIFLDKAPQEIVGKKLHDLFPEPWVEERMQVLRRISAEGRPVILRNIRRGKQIQSLIRPLDTAEGSAQRFLTLTLLGEHDEVEDGGPYEVVESEVADFGPLDVLTRRELEVLALIKHGMSIQQIAETLHRSPKTIQSHRDSIARKLNETNRVRLAEIAQEAGLELRDAGLKRI